MVAYHLYLLRHGITEANLAGKYIGSTDEPLCQKALAERIEKELQVVERRLRAKVARRVEVEPPLAVESQLDPALTWSDLEWLVESCGLPVAGSSTSTSAGP